VNKTAVFCFHRGVFRARCPYAEIDVEIDLQGVRVESSRQFGGCV
jgi:hypothetical protein